jgi:hypothetical protein
MWSRGVLFALQSPRTPFLDSFRVADNPELLHQWTQARFGGLILWNSLWGEFISIPGIPGYSGVLVHPNTLDRRRAPCLRSDAALTFEAFGLSCVAVLQSVEARLPVIAACAMHECRGGWPRCR